MKHPFLDLAAADAPLAGELAAAMTRVIRSGRYVGGEEVAAFEQALAQSCGAAHAVGVANGLDALRLILRGWIIQGKMMHGDEVIVPANTYVASVLAILDAGLRPVLAEPSWETMNLDTERLDQYLSERTRAVMTVHLYGRSCFDAALKRFAADNSLLIIEDNAQAIGATAPETGFGGSNCTGALGHAAAFSFYPTKNIGAIGDAGAVTTGDAELAAIVRALANYGSDRRYHNIYIGQNSRLDPVQAAVLNVKMRLLEAETARRRELARIYSGTITHKDILLPQHSANGGDVWHQYVVRTPRRDALQQHLAAAGIGTDIHYAVPPHRQPALEAMFADNAYPITERIAAQCLSLPIGGNTTVEAAAEIAAAVNAWCD